MLNFNTLFSLYLYLYTFIFIYIYIYIHLYLYTNQLLQHHLRLMDDSLVQWYSHTFDLQMDLK